MGFSQAFGPLLCSVSQPPQPGPQRILCLLGLAGYRFGRQAQRLAHLCVRADLPQRIRAAGKRPWSRRTVQSACQKRHASVKSCAPRPGSCPTIPDNPERPHHTAPWARPARQAPCGPAPCPGTLPRHRWHGCPRLSAQQSTGPMRSPGLAHTRPPVLPASARNRQRAPHAAAVPRPAPAAIPVPPAAVPRSPAPAATSAAALSRPRAPAAFCPWKIQGTDSVSGKYGLPAYCRCVSSVLSSLSAVNLSPLSPGPAPIPAAAPPVYTALPAILRDKPAPQASPLAG